MFGGGGGCIYISGIEQNWKVKVSIQTNLTHINTIFEYFHASANSGNVDVLYLEDGNVCRPVLKNKTSTMFFLKKSVLVLLLKLAVEYFSRTQNIPVLLNSEYVTRTIFYFQNTEQNLFIKQKAYYRTRIFFSENRTIQFISRTQNTPPHDTPHYYI